MSRREAREQRERAKQAKAAQDKLKLLDNLGMGPRMAEEPEAPIAPRVAPHLARELEKDSSPKTVYGSRFSELVSWCITRIDQEGHWSWGEPRAWTELEWTRTIHPKFKEFEQKTWAEIDQMASGEGHKMHHGHEITDLVLDAQERWKELDLEEFDDVFRFRLGNKKRAWGYIVQAHFFMVWWERNHKIYVTADDN